MLGILPDREIERVLREQFVGRIGCHADGRTYVVPIAYAYADGCIYGHTVDGLKLRMMRKNPHVCFEVDCVDDPMTWQSVIAWGTFEQLHGDAASHAMQTLLVKFLPGKTHLTDRGLQNDRPGVGDGEAIVYRIRLTERTGRFERSALQAEKDDYVPFSPPT
ncbi:MAG: pyridoxamine 5'-phosphate oxidase family protein [Candidatus Eremiobacteraeota bacterium]|nr:pyridoxamine 5'-phosphate oxidase family protein [Candidatus Eremiobacteraeota bacterium]